MRRAYKNVVLHRKIVVNLLNGKAIEGVLWQEARDLLVLKGAILHDPASNGPVAVDGEVLVERSRIDFVQVVG